jgi:hypothetical protein
MMLQEERGFTSVTTSKTSQKIYSAQSCNTVTESKTECNLKGRILESTLRVEQSPIYAPIIASENTTISSGGEVGL